MEYAPLPAQDNARPRLPWVAGVASRAKVGAQSMLNIDEVIEQVAAAKVDLAEGRRLDVGYHAVAALLAAAGGAAKVVAMGAQQAARFAPAVGNAVAAAVPGDPLKVAAMAWRLGGQEASAYRQLRAGRSDIARDRAVFGLAQMVAGLGSMAIGAGAVLLVAVVAPVAAPVVGIGAALGFSMCADKALGRIDGKLKARLAAREVSELAALSAAPAVRAPAP